MSDYGRLQDERDALLVENENLRARVAELESVAVTPTGDNQIAVEADTAPAGDPMPTEPVDWDAVYKAETDKVIAEGQPNG